MTRSRSLGRQGLPLGSEDPTGGVGPGPRTHSGLLLSLLTPNRNTPADGVGGRVKGLAYGAFVLRLLPRDVSLNTRLSLLFSLERTVFRSTYVPILWVSDRLILHQVPAARSCCGRLPRRVGVSVRLVYTVVLYEPSLALGCANGVLPPSR